MAKKIIALLIVLMLAVFTLFSCAPDGEPDDTPVSDSQESEDNGEENSDSQNGDNDDNGSQNGNGGNNDNGSNESGSKNEVDENFKENDDYQGGGITLPEVDL